MPQFTLKFKTEDEMFPDNYVMPTPSWDKKVESKYEELKRRGYHDTLKHSMQFTLLSVITHIRPKRADLGAVEIYRDEDPRKTDQNYIVLRNPKEGGSYLVMNMYKTSKYYQTVFWL